MSLRRKTLIIIGVTTIALMAILYFSLRIILLRSFAELEEKIVRKNVERALNALHSDLAALDTLVHDWAASDEAYAFIQNGNEDYIRSNLVPEAFINTALNTIVYVNSSGQIVFAKSFDLHLQREMPIPDSLSLHLSPNMPLLSHSDPNSRVAGLILLSDGPMLVASRPILTSENKGPVRGSLIMGRRMTSSEIEQIGQRIELPVAIRPIDDAESPLDFREARSGLSKETSVVVHPPDADTIAGYTALRDIYGKPILILRVSRPRDIYRQGHGALRLLFSSQLFIGLIFVGLTLLLLEKLVLSRLSGLSRSVSSIGAHGDLSARVSVSGEDELSRLAGDINEMLSALELATKNLFEERRSLERKVELRTQELRDSLRQLEEANRHKNRFLSSMSHELRTPLNVILGFTELLRGQFFGALNEKQLDHMDRIEESSRHLLALISDLLDMAKIDAGAIELELEQFPPSEVIDSVVAMMSALFRKKRLAVEIFADPALAVMTGDKRRCKQIMLNLLSNAQQYTPEGGRIEVHVRKQGEAARIEVLDTGIGIEPNERDKIFSEFYQGDRVRDGKLGGAGIGLALARSLVRLHGGEIGVESERGKGSTFWFTLPHKRTARAEDAARTQPIQTKEAGLRGRRVLVAEDNEANLAMMLDMLSTQGLEILAAKNGQEAIELAQLHRPELILMDVLMPVMDGMEAIRRLRAMTEFAHIPIIAVTATAGDEAEKNCLAAGFTAHLAKPIQYNELFAALHRYLIDAAVPK